MLHQNSQKRIYFPEAIYFVTICVQDRFPFFKEEMLCDLLIEELKLCKILKQFLLFGFVVLSDHIHLLIQPNNEHNISEIIRSLKINYSRNINNIIKTPEGAVTSPRLRGIGLNYLNKILPKYQNQFIQKYGTKQFQFPKFQWQKSFFDHYIRNDNDFENHLEYIWRNPEKHGMTDNFEKYQYSSYNDNYQELIDYFN